MFGPIKALVFDFDGTLVDTMTSVTKGLGFAVEQATGRKVPRDELVATFGPAPQAVLEKWMPTEKIPEAMRVWLEFEKTTGPADMVPFAGAESLLEFLGKAAYKFAIFTGRDRAGTLRILEAHGWLGRFFNEERLVCGDDGFRPKPSGEGLVHMMKVLGVEASDTLMVGDHPHDMAAGREAGCKTAAALWDLGQEVGSTDRARFRNAWSKWPDSLCDLKLSSLSSLESWLNKPG